MSYKKVKTVINHFESQEMVLRAVGFSADEVESIINDCDGDRMTAICQVKAD